MRKVTMKELVDKDIRITDFHIEKYMKSKKDKAIVELEVNGEYCYFETTSLEVLYQLSLIKSCVMNYKLKTNTNKIRWVKTSLDSTTHYKTNGDAYIVTEEFSSTESENNRYLCFYKNSVYVKVIREKTSIYFSFKISPETIDNLIKNDNAAYTKKVEKIIKEEKSHAKTN